MDKNTHVYCTLCKHGAKLLANIELTPDECVGCEPTNPEDSMRYEDRPNYLPLSEK